MADNSIEDYALAYVLGNAERLNIPDSYMRSEELWSHFAEEIENHLASLDARGLVNTTITAQKLYELMLDYELFGVIGDAVAGDYIAYRPGKYAKFRDQILSNSPIYSVASRVGNRFYKDVFDKFSEINSGTSVERGETHVDAVAPASDRVVTFSDNEISDFDIKTSEIISAVSAQNQIDGSPGLREILLGQLKAGRELIRAGSFKLYVLEVTLVQSLTFLAQRYEKEAIGALAAALLTTLLKHIGIDG